MNLAIFLASNSSLFLRGQFMETPAFHDFLDSVAQTSPSSSPMGGNLLEMKTKIPHNCTNLAARSELEERQSPHSTTPNVPNNVQNIRDRR